MKKIVSVIVLSAFLLALGMTPSVSTQAAADPGPGPHIMSKTTI